MQARGRSPPGSDPPQMRRIRYVHRGLTDMAAMCRPSRTRGAPRLALPSRRCPHVAVRRRTVPARVDQPGPSRSAGQGRGAGHGPQPGARARNAERCGQAGSFSQRAAGAGGRDAFRLDAGDRHVRPCRRRRQQRGPTGSRTPVTPFPGAWTWGENLAWFGTTGTVDLAAAAVTHDEGLFLSPGHRVNLLADAYREIGIAQVEGAFTHTNGITYNASMLTEKFARTGTDVFLHRCGLFGYGRGRGLFHRRRGGGPVLRGWRAGHAERDGRRLRAGGSRRPPAPRYGSRGRALIHGCPWIPAVATPSSTWSIGHGSSPRST